MIQPSPQSDTSDVAPTRLRLPLRDLAVVAGAALALRLLFAGLTADTYDYDEFVLLLLGRDLAHGDGPYTDFMFFHPPVALYFLRALQPLTDLWWPSARVLTALLDVVTAGLVWRIGLQLYGRVGGVVAGLLYAASPLALISAVRIGQDPLITALGLGGLTLLLTQTSRRAALVAGLMLAVAAGIKYSALYFLPIYILAAPRRSPALVPGLLAGTVLWLAPIAGHLQALYDQTIEFQRTRWHMQLHQRIETTILYWLVVNPLAIPGYVRGTPPPWLAVGFALGGIFVFAPQTYYHYFVPIVPFAALLGAPALMKPIKRPAGKVARAGLAVTLAWGLFISHGGLTPLYITAASLSSLQETVQIVERASPVEGPILADRYEYAYLSKRPALAHYFWNIGVLVRAPYLERRVHRAAAVVLSSGASFGYPIGFHEYMDRHYNAVRTENTLVWLTAERRRK